MSEHEPWFGVRLLYRHLRATGQTFEERILIIRSPTAEDAIEATEKLSIQDYEHETTERLGYAMTFNIFDCNGPSLPNGSEVFSLIRDSDLTPAVYLDRFYDSALSGRAHRGRNAVKLKTKP
ncbi:MAG: hypothetical protein R3C03_01595 [Pirellulaceae bacterium]